MLKYNNQWRQIFKELAATNKKNANTQTEIQTGYIDRQFIEIQTNKHREKYLTT